MQCYTPHAGRMKRMESRLFSYAHTPAGSKNIAAVRQVFWLAPFCGAFPTQSQWHRVPQMFNLR